MKTSVAMVDDDTSLLALLRHTIEASTEFYCVGAYATPELALKELVSLRPRIVLMDIRMPHVSGLECTRRLTRAIPGVCVIIMTGTSSSENLVPAIDAGAIGFLQKPFQPSDCVNALRSVVSGGAPVSPPAIKILVDYVRRDHATKLSSGPLSPRESEVMRLLSNKEIALALGISQATVHNQLQRIYEKLSVHSRGQAVAQFLQIIHKT
jgi:DNA-binding NarL/FixJ family response regulator